MRSARGWFLFLLLTVCSYGVSGQTLTGFPVGARNTSMVNSNVAEATDVSVMYENPAPLAFLEHRGLLINHSQGMESRGMQESVAFPLFLKSPVVVAVGLDAYHEVNAHGAVPAGDRMFVYGYDVALAGEITPTLSIGGSGFIRHGSLASGSDAWGSTFSFGVDYAPTPDVSYGLVFGGLGKDIPFPAGDSVLPLRSEDMQRTIEVGATMVFPSSASLRPPSLILSFSNQKLIGASGLIYKGGVELRGWNTVGVSFGYLAGPRVHSARYGVGYFGKQFGLHYAIYPQQARRTPAQQVSLMLML